MDENLVDVAGRREAILDLLRDGHDGLVDDGG